MHVEGEPAVGTIVALDANTLSLEVEATHIPESISVSVEGLEAGSQIHASDLTLPTGAALVSDPETLVVNITVPAVADLGESDEAEGEEAAEGEAGAEAEAAGDSE